MPSSDVLDWMLDSDPALRWQVERDLLRAPEPVWQATRARIATEGFGAKLLALQDPDGQWAGGAFFPANFDFEGPEAAKGAGQPWTATTWVLNQLRDFGLPASALGDTAARLAANSRWEYDSLPYWGGEVDVCINAWTVANGAWLGVDVTKLAAWFVEHRFADGGWNCEWVNGAKVASFHSTLNALKGLLEYEERVGPREDLRAVRRAGEEYLLSRHLHRRRSTGEPVAPWVSELVHPPRWRYSVLNAAEYFRAASLFEDRPPDPRIADAIALIRAARTPEGKWLQARRLPGRVWFEVDVDAGEPSKWITHSALRVLAWWDRATS